MPSTVLTAPASLDIGHHGLFAASHQDDNCDYFKKIQNVSVL